MSGAGSAPRPRAEQLRDFVAGARWFGGKGRPFEVTDVRRLWLSERADARVAVELLTLAYADGGSDLYQVPLTYRSPDRTGGGANAGGGTGNGTGAARVGSWNDAELGPVVAHDALQDPDSAALWLAAFTADAPGEGSAHLEFHRVPEAALGPPGEVAGWAPKLLRGEQSNTSVVFGDRALLKVFRRLAPGQNPDIEILSALTAAGSAQVAPLYGWIETSALESEPVQLGILQQFLVGAHDGWVLALDDLAASPAAPDSFTTQARALGAAVGRMHTALAASFPTERWEGPRLAQVADAMRTRLDAAVAVVPDLASSAEGLTALFDGVRRLEQPVVAQRVHGDLHLGQTLWRQDDGWKIIDFEGEPAKSLAERRSPDCALRDVAGMLRSFDYAAESAGRTAAERGLGPEGDDRPRLWATATSEAFLAGYGDGGGAGLDPVLLAAYEADKAVYEAVYEARNRPAWLPIPLAALSRLTDRPSEATDRPVSAVRGGA